MPPNDPRAFDVENIRVAKLVGGSLSQSVVLKGMVVTRPPTGMPSLLSLFVLRGLAIARSASLHRSRSTSFLLHTVCGCGHPSLSLSISLNVYISIEREKGGCGSLQAGLLRGDGDLECISRQPG